MAAVLFEVLINNMGDNSNITILRDTIFDSKSGF